MTHHCLFIIDYRSFYHYITWFQRFHLLCHQGIFGAFFELLVSVLFYLPVFFFQMWFLTIVWRSLHPQISIPPFFVSLLHPILFVFLHYIFQFLSYLLHYSGIRKICVNTKELMVTQLVGKAIPFGIFLNKMFWQTLAVNLKKASLSIVCSL